MPVLRATLTTKILRQTPPHLRPHLHGSESRLTLI
jgi:hypothetical protein